LEQFLIGKVCQDINPKDRKKIDAASINELSQDASNLS